MPPSIKIENEVFVKEVTYFILNAPVAINYF